MQNKREWIIYRPESNPKVVLVLSTPRQDDVNSKTDRSFKLMFDIKLTLTISIHSFLDVSKSFVSLKYAWTKLSHKRWNLVYTVTRVLDERVVKA